MRFSLLVLALFSASIASGQLQPTNPVPRVVLAWDPSPDPAVTGYNVYYGAQSRFYTNMVNAGATNTCTISNLVRGVTYYFAATCYNSTGLESEFSNEVTWTPAALPIAPVLRLAMAGGSAMLQGQAESYSLMAIERSTNLAAWCELEIVSADRTGNFWALDPFPEFASAFYRTKQ